MFLAKPVNSIEHNIDAFSFIVMFKADLVCFRSFSKDEETLKTFKV